MALNPKPTPVGGLESSHFLEAALKYAAMGWFLLPVKGKQPILGNWREKSSNDPNKIRAWFEDGQASIGVDLDRSGLVVIDADHPEHLAAAGLDADALDGWEFNGNPDRRSWLYRLGDIEVRQGKADWGDVKAQGGMVVLPPSAHHGEVDECAACDVLGVGAHHYAWRERIGEEPPMLGSDVAARLPKSGHASAKADVPLPIVPLATSAAALRLDGILHRLAKAGKGSRNDTLNWAVYRASGLVARVSEDQRGDALDEETVKARLKDVALALGLTVGETDTTIASGWPAGSEDPMQATGDEMDVMPDVTAPSGVRPESADRWPEIPGRLTDAYLVEWLAWKGLGGMWLWAAGLGWLSWDGRRWVQRGDEDAKEAVRRAMIAVNQKAVVMLPPDRMSGYVSLLSNNRLGALTALLKGVVSVEAGEFDRQPDLLNVGNGIVDLRTGELLPHDPALRLMKISQTPYVPDARHADFDQVCTALDPEVMRWMQLRVGQGATGHPTSDDVLPVGQGVGANGKSTFVSALFTALGEHIALVPEKLLLATASAHPTELMSLRGVRLAIIEETPESRDLNIQRLKAVLGTGRITARSVYKDFVSWEATHSLLLFSNYVPLIRETDHGTWRRLALVKYTKKFAKDDRFRARVAAGRGGLAEAALAWVIEGAKAWYANEKVLPPAPARVEDDTRAWRGESDVVLGFIDESLEFDPDSCIAVQDLLEGMNWWLKDRRQSEWSALLFAARFGQHEAVVAAGVEKVRPRKVAELSSRWRGRPAPGERPWVWRGVRWALPDDDDLVR